MANVSHDLRNPLALLQGYLETLLLKEDRLSASERRHFTEIGLGSARRLSGLVEQLFELSRLDAQEIKPAPENFPLEELAQDLLLQMRPRAGIGGVELQLDRQGDLPEARADIAMIERALANLLDNAIRYTPAGGRVTLALAAVPGGIRLDVRDTGVGIPAQELPRVFDRFYRITKSRTELPGEGGTGLGLAIASKLIALCGSELAVESTPGEGSCFHFTIPAAFPTPARGNASIS